MLTKKLPTTAPAAALPLDLTRNENVLAKKSTGTRGRPPAPEARSRVLLGEALMNDLKKYRDAQAEKLGFSPSIAKTIAMLLTAAKR